MKKAIVFLSFITPLLLSLPSYALPENQVVSTLKTYLEKGNLCSDGQDFWHRDKVLSPLNGYSRPRPELDLGLVSLLNIQLSRGDSEAGDQLIVDLVLDPKIKLGMTSDVLEDDGERYGLRFSRFGCSDDKQKIIAAGKKYKGALVIGPGRSEGAVEYYETALDFVELGYSPVYVIDHRGQGASPRLPMNPQIGHLVNFNHYIDDFAYAVNKIKSDIPAFTESSLPPLFYTSNSMGGAIGIGYLSKYADSNPFEKVALLGAMVKVNNLSFIDKEPNQFNKALYSEKGAILQALVNCADPLPGLGLKKDKCDQYARPEVFGDYNPTKRVFTENSEAMMTHSRSRYSMRTYLWNEFDWSEIISQEYGANENWQGPQMGGASFNWVLATSDFLLNDMRTPESVAKLPTAKIKYITGTQDLRGYNPYFDDQQIIQNDMSNYIEFCNMINEHNSHGDSQLCEFTPIEGGYHELYKESDEYRNQALEMVDQFFTAK